MLPRFFTSTSCLPEPNILNRSDEVRPGGSGEAEDGWKPSASFTAGVRAALSNFLPNGSNQSWQTSKRSSSGRPQGYDDSPATAQLIDAVLEVNFPVPLQRLSF